MRKSGRMTGALVLILLAVLVAVALPTQMGEMRDCPMCTYLQTIALGICAAILALLLLVVMMASSRLCSGENSFRHFLLARSVYRPPRVV